MPDSIRPTESDSPQPTSPLHTPIKRRSFFMYAGATAGATALALAGCKDDEVNAASSSPNVSLGTGDFSVLHYAYTLEQLEAAFYAKVVSSAAATTTGLSTNELTYFTRMAAHEAIHRDFLMRAIGRDFPNNGLVNITPNFDGINFAKRARDAGDTKLGILDAAKAFEDLGVAAYNGAARLLKTSAYVGILGQIVSVEARHAAYVRNLLLPGSFAASDQVDTSGLDKQLPPSAVIQTVNTFLDASKIQLDVSTIGQ
jgi:hypothetical protein